MRLSRRRAIEEQEAASTPEIDPTTATIDPSLGTVEQPVVAVTPPLSPGEKRRGLIRRLAVAVIALLVVFFLADTLVESRRNGRLLDRTIGLLEEAQRQGQADRDAIAMLAQQLRDAGIEPVIVPDDNGDGVPMIGEEPTGSGEVVGGVPRRPGSTAPSNPRQSDGSEPERDPGTSRPPQQQPQPRPSSNPPPPPPQRPCRVVNPLTGECIVRSGSGGTTVGPVEAPVGIPPLGLSATRQCSVVMLRCAS